MLRNYVKVEDVKVGNYVDGFEVVGIVRTNGIITLYFSNGSNRPVKIGRKVNIVWSR